MIVSVVAAPAAPAEIGVRPVWTRSTKAVPDANICAMPSQNRNGLGRSRDRAAGAFALTRG